MAGTPGHGEHCQVCVQDKRLHGMETGREGKGRESGRDARVKLLGMVLATPDCCVQH